MKQIVIFLLLLITSTGCQKTSSTEAHEEKILSMLEEELKNDYFLELLDGKIQIRNNRPRITLSLCCKEEIDLLTARLLIHKVAQGLKERCLSHWSQLILGDLEISISFLHPENRMKKRENILFVSLLAGKVYYTTYAEEEGELFDFRVEELTLY